MMRNGQRKKGAVINKKTRGGYRYLGLNNVLSELERCSPPDVSKKTVEKNGLQHFQRVAEQTVA
jgi:hypothetical protein